VVSPAEFARLLARLDSETFREFVFDLWRAREPAAAVEGDDLVVTHPATGDAERIRPVTDPSEIEGSIDVAVVRRDTDRLRRLADAAGVRYVPPTTLRGLALYGVDRETGDALFREYFDRPIEGGDAADGGSRRLDPFASLAVAAVLLAAVLLAGFAPAPQPTADAEPTARGTVTPVTVDGDTPTPAPSRDGDGAVNVTRYLSGDAVDAAVLARGHADALANRSYTWRVTHNGSRSLDGARWIRAERTVRVAGLRVYEHQFRGHRAVRGGEAWSVRYREYADGESVYREETGAASLSYERFRLSRVRTADVFTDRASVYVERYLTTTEVDVTEVLIGGSPAYRLRATGTPTQLEANASSPGDAALRFPGETISNYSAVAYVRWSGIVVALDVSYTVGGRAVQFSFSYDAIGATRPAAPPWYDEARNETRRDVIGRRSDHVREAT
jgi:hypothetical protein